MEIETVLVPVEQMRAMWARTPIRHESFSPELLKRMEQTYRDAGRYIDDTLEKWELGFMKDTNPESEVALWEKIAAAFGMYKEKVAKRKSIPAREATRIIGLLCSISSGDPLLDINATQRRQLLACYEHVGGVVAPFVIISKGTA